MNLSSLVAKVGALLVFLGVVGGATYAALKVDVDDRVAAAFGTTLRAETVHPALNGTAGHTVTYVVVVSNRGADDVRFVARVAGDGFDGASDATLLPRKENRTVFVPVAIGASAAPGAHALDLRLETPEGGLLRADEGAVSLRVLAPGAPGFGDGVTASVVYAGRLPEGGVFNTNDAGLLAIDFPKAGDLYQASASGPIRIAGGPRAGVLEGFYELLEGMQAGESRTATLPVEKAYGPATLESVTNRTETFPRTYALPIRDETVPRATFDGYARDTGQAASWSVGSAFFYEDGPNRWPYRIVDINDATVVYRLAAEPGQTFTLYQFWMDGSEVVAVNETAAVLRTTPTTPVGSNVTVVSHWPEMTTLVDVTEQSIVVRHDPPVGFRHKILLSTGQQVDAVVQSVDERRIVTSTASAYPLAGRALTFDVFVESLTT